jgi:RHS repeat-associated protein
MQAVLSHTNQSFLGELTPSNHANNRCSTYFFGFNGKEKDTEWTGQQGSHLDFGARIYDSRIGRWTALDPLAAKYPDVSPYCFVKNMPIIAIDPNGKEPNIINKILESRNLKQGYKVVINNKTKEITIFKTEASFSNEKISPKSNPNIVVTSSVIQMNANGEVKDILVTKEAISAKMERERVISSQSEKIEREASNADNIDELKDKYSNDDPIVQGISDLSQSVNRDALYSQDNFLPGLSLFDRTEKNIGSIISIGGILTKTQTPGADCLTPDLGNRTLLNIKLERAGSARNRLQRIAEKAPVNKL